MAKRKKAARKPAKRPPRAVKAHGKNKGLAALYEHVGYRGNEAPARAKARPVRGARALTAPARTTDEGPLTPAKLEELEAEFKRDPKGLLKIVRKSVGKSLTEFELRRMLARAREATEQPVAYVRMARRRSVLLGQCDPPSDIPADPDIPITPCTTKFEGLRDWDGWTFNCGPWWLKQKFGNLPTAPMPRHSADSPFVYPMKAQDGTPLGASDTIMVALFSDFGTGQYHSRYIAKHIRDRAPHYAIHLGDVYYAGIAEEIREHLAAPLRPIFDRSRVFAMNGNHEMLSGGFGYFQYLQDKRNAGAQVEQEQEGSYFSLVSDRYQIVAIDTAYDWKHDGELRDAQQGAWLRERLLDGKSHGRTNILLSQHEPFGLGERKENALFRQVRDSATREDGTWLVDYWFWGDEHYCVRYKTSAHVPFVGSCVGHAGHPVDLQDVHRRVIFAAPFAQHEWVDTAPRFPSFREDELGSAGFCLLELGPAAVKVSYIDWLNKVVKTFP